MIIILDLDQTLVDSSIAENLRRNRRWPLVYQQIPNFTVYPGIEKLLQFLRFKDVKIAVVTNSPSSYAKKTLEHFKLPYDALVAYHDTTAHKPHPAPYLKAIEYLNQDDHEILAVGDKVNDIIAAQKASIKGVAALWGSSEIKELENSSPDYIAKTPDELLQIFKQILETHTTQKEA